MSEMKLDEAGQAAAVYHKVVLAFAVKQDGQPFMDLPVTYYHCTDAVQAYIVGMVAGMGAALGPKGKKAKDGNFAVDITVTSDDAPVASGSWDGLGREGSLLFEKYVLENWLHMNQQAFVAAKAHGKI
jgi:hypothetical protein